MVISSNPPESQLSIVFLSPLKMLIASVGFTFDDAEGRTRKEYLLDL